MTTLQKAIEDIKNVLSNELSVDLSDFPKSTRKSFDISIKNILVGLGVATMIDSEVRREIDVECDNHPA